MNKPRSVGIPQPRWSGEQRDEKFGDCEELNVFVDGAKAKRLLEIPPLEGQRNIRPAWVRAFQRLAEDQHLVRGGRIVIFHLDETGESFLGDAHHRLRGLVEANKRMVTGAFFDIRHFRCGSHDEINQVYKAIDRGHLKGAGDLLKVLGFQNQHRCVLSAVAFIEANFVGGRNIPPIDPQRYEVVMKEWEVEWAEYLGMLRGRSRETQKFLMLQGAMAVALLTLRDDSERAVRFWDGVARKEGMEETVAQRQVMEFLATTSVHPSKNEQDRRGYGSLYIARGVAECWNAFRLKDLKGEVAHVRDLRRRLREKEAAPFRIAGTLITGTSIAGTKERD